MSRQDLYPALQMTGACNKRCKACIRPPDENVHQLRWQDFQAYLADLSRFSTAMHIRYQFVTGGEPTLWRDGDVDIIDVLAAISALDFVETIVMPTNGRLFEDEVSAQDFVERLSARIERPVAVGVSVADFQENLVDGKCAALENLTRACCQTESKVVPVALVTVAVDDDPTEQLSSLLPQVFQRVVALAPMGAGEALAARCPSLLLSGRDKGSLGAFLPHMRRDAQQKLGVSAVEFDSMANQELVDRMSLHNNCGRSPFVDSHWHYCLPMADDSAYDLGAVGAATPSRIDDIVQKRPYLSGVQERGVVTSLMRERDGLSRDVRDRVDGMLGQPTPVAYRGCLLCKSFQTCIASAEAGA